MQQGWPDSSTGDAHLAMPLPERVRPKVYEDVYGQERVWGGGAPLRRLVESDRYTALLFWGPPGTGKTSLARLIGGAAGRPVEFLSAVRHGVKEIRDKIAASADRLAAGQPAILIFMDEIHRLNRSQQDVLLPSLEAGTVRFIGATTENPSFEVNAAVLSRMIVFRFERLTAAALEKVLQRALTNPLAALPRVDVAPDVVRAIAAAADGDARRALNLLEAVCVAASPGRTPIDCEAVAPLALDLVRQYDKSGDAHYDIVSALIKSIRASQPDAAVYYLARMLDGGEDPMFMARRLVVAASEDVGNANPTALLVATSAMQAVHLVGMPEARIILAQVVTYLAASPKSNRAYIAIERALEDVKETGAVEVPLFLRNAPTALMRAFGHGAGYVYAHDNQKGAQRTAYLPASLRGRRYYEPLDLGAEGQLKRNLETLARLVDVTDQTP